MALQGSLVQQSGNEGFILSFPRAQVAQIHFADIDLIIRTTEGRNYILPGGAIAAMEKNPPRVVFSDGAVTIDRLLSNAAIANDPSLNTHTMASDKRPDELDADFDKQKEKELQEAKDKVEEKDKDLKKAEEIIEEQKKKIEESEQKAEELQEAKEQLEELEDQNQQMQQREALAKAENAEAEAAEKVEKIVEQLHSKDYDYSPPPQFSPPPSPFSGPAGVPAPISMNPLVLLTMGNVVGMETSGATIYGGGGAAGSDATAKLGPRDALQFSAATITGTAGDDTIYAEGPLVGNINPAVDTSLYAKQFLLRVAGYFTELNDIVFQGLPAYVTVTGAALQGDGSWVLPAAYVVSQQSFELVYDKDAWRSDTNTFDMTVVVSGEARGATFTSTEIFRFQFMDVTDAAQSTNPYLTFWDDGQNKQIYVLQTQDQPNIIDAGAGNDIIYGGRNHDTIDAGDGADQIFAYGGNNVITAGDGNDQITTGDDNDTVDGGAGDDTIVAGAGTNTIVAGEGLNTITSGGGADLITAGAGNDVINAGDGANSINAGDGNNIITTGSGSDSIIVGAGNNTITAGDGNNSITTGDGDNVITTGSGADTVTLGAGTNSVTAGSGNDRLYGGAGDDTLLGEGGDDTLRGGMGTNILTGGLGNNTADYTGLGVAITASILAGTGIGVGVSDTYSDIHNITGSSDNDVLTGDANTNILSGAEGNDTITGGGGIDYLYGGDGDDLITGGADGDYIYGGAGADTINGGGAGVDHLYGNDGDDIFTNTTAGVFYDGGAGIDKVDYSTEATSIIIDLGAGLGYSGRAAGSSFSSIEWIVTGSSSDTLTGSSGDDILDGGSGNDTFTGAAGNNTLIGGSGSNYYNMGTGYDYIVANVGGWDELRYQSSPVAIVVNLDSVEHSFTNSLGATVTVAAQSGSSRQETVGDSASWSLGDTYSLNGVDYVYGSNYNDVIYGSSSVETIHGNGGNDQIFSGGGNDYLYMSSGNDLMDGQDGIDMFYVNNGANMFAYLDGTLDSNANGTSDYLDRSVSAIYVGSGYTGFAGSWSGTTLINNAESLIGSGGGDYLAGDNNANELNGQTGNNKLYGMGGDDLIFANMGNNTIDGGTGIDAVSFSNVNMTLSSTSVGGWGYNSSVIAEVYLVDTDLDGNGVLDKAGTWGAYSSFSARANLSGVYSYQTITGIENIVGTQNADKLAGDANANIIRGYSGDDLISGNGGADSLYGDNGNDTFVVNSSHMATLSLLSGGSNTDTIKSAGWTYAANSFYTNNAKYTNIEAVDTRNSAAGQAYGLNAYDIQSLVDSGNSSVLTIRLDSGDTFTYQIGAGTGALSCLQTTDTATYDVFKYYSDAGHVVDNSTNLVSIVNVYYGA